MKFLLLAMLAIIYIPFGVIFELTKRYQGGNMLVYRGHKLVHT